MSSIDGKVSAAELYAENNKQIRRNLRAVYWTLLKEKVKNFHIEVALLAGSIFVASGLLTLAFSFWIWLFGRVVFRLF